MPECATCGEYISPDFARVFGDNDRVVTACLSCRGNAPEPNASEPDEVVAEPNEAASAPQAVVAGADNGVEAGFDGANESEADEYDVDDDSEPMVDNGAEPVEPETAVTAGESSPLAFLRSVFLR